MKKVCALMVCLALAFVAVGCSPTTKLYAAYQFSTVTLIEQDKVSPEAVIERVQLARVVLERSDSTTTMGALFGQVKLVAGYESLSLASQIVIDTLLEDAHINLDVLLQSLITDELREQIELRLTWIEAAARRVQKEQAVPT